MSSIKKYQYNYSDLSIDRGELNRLIGFEKDELPEPFLSYLIDAETTANKDGKYKGAFLITEKFIVDLERSVLIIEDIQFRPGRVILNQIKQANKLALFVCTAGNKISEQAQEELSEGDPVAGYILDLLGSLTVEAAIEDMQNDLETIHSKEGSSISNRFSPGYCGWKVEEQHKLFSLFPEGFTEITLTSGALMNPIKSVSGLIGIGSNVERKAYTCSFCDDTNCLYRKLRKGDDC